ncbi:hypothetical protein P9112_002807 [Eukaryota sp. TZLM1-RC]
MSSRRISLPQACGPRRLNDWNFSDLALPQKTYQQEHVIVKTGELSPALIIISGTAKVVTELVSQNVQITSVSEGAVIGELELLRNVPSRCDLVATTNVTAFVLERSTLLSALERAPSDVSTLLFRTCKAFSSVFFDFLPALRSHQLRSHLSTSPSMHTSSLESLPAIVEDEDLEEPSSVPSLSLSIPQHSGFISYDSAPCVRSNRAVSDASTSVHHASVLDGLNITYLADPCFTPPPSLPEWLIEIARRCLERVCGTMEVMGSEGGIGEDLVEGTDSDDSTTQSFLSDYDSDCSYDSDDSCASSVHSFSSTSFADQFKHSGSISRRQSIADCQSNFDSSCDQVAVDGTGSVSEEALPRANTSPYVTNLPFAAALMCARRSNLLSPSASSDLSNNSSLEETDDVALEPGQEPTCSLFGRTLSVPGVAGDDNIYIMGSPPAAHFINQRRPAVSRSSTVPCGIEFGHCSSSSSVLSIDTDTECPLSPLDPFEITYCTARRIERLLLKSNTNTPLSWNFDYWNVENDKRAACKYLERLLGGYISHLRESEGFHGIFIGIKANQVRKFIELSMNNYSDDVAFHNHSHAFGVTCSMVFLLRARPISSCLSPLDRLALVLACITHDLSHPGYNAVLDKVLRPSAYSCFMDCSRRKSLSEVTLEDLHLTQAFEVLEKSEILSSFSNDQKDYVIKGIKTCIMATDLSQHFSSLQDAQSFAKTLTKPWRTQSTKSRKLLMRLLIKLVDLDNQSKDPKLAISAAMRVTYELFDQGDKEKELGMPVPSSRDRTLSNVLQIQLDFISFFVEPLVSCLVKMFPFLKPIHSSLDSNSFMYSSLKEKFGSEPDGLKTLYDWYKGSFKCEIDFFERVL